MNLDDLESPIREHRLLLENIRRELEILEKKKNFYSKQFEDFFYRFYYGSFKVYLVQKATKDIVENLRNLSPLEDKKLSPIFEEIFNRGTQKIWTEESNKRWLEETSPMINAFFHSKYFLELVINCGKKLNKAPSVLPYDWAAVLCLYRLR